MKCADVYQLLSEGKSPTEVRMLAAQHLANCPRCRELLDLFDEPLELPYDEPGRRSHVAAKVLSEVSAARPLASTYRIVLGILGSVALVSFLWFLAMGAPGYEKLDSGRRLALFLYLVVLTGLLAFSLARLARPAARQPLSPFLLLTASLVGYPLLASLLFPLHPHGDFIAEGLVCLSFGLITAILSSALIWRFVSRGYFRHGVLAGALIGALGGVSALVALHFVCMYHDLGHTLLWHGAVLVSSELIGAAAGWLLSRRARA